MYYMVFNNNVENIMHRFSLKIEQSLLKPNKSFQFLVSVCIASNLCISIFSCLFFRGGGGGAMKRCLIAAKIAGSNEILPYCVLKDVFTSVNVCPICVASVTSHYTLCMGNLVWFQ